ncbi:hypothetical protein [Qipengyuania sp. 902]|uniref:hypothetical protein n=1 Tax=Qipengyuania sp. 902 TaxID=3417565 RepID=UPI003EBD3C20
MPLAPTEPAERRASYGAISRLRDWWHALDDDARRKAGGLVFALLLEALLLLLLLSLGLVNRDPVPMRDAVSTFDVGDAREEADEALAEPAPAPATAQSQVSPPEPVPDQPVPQPTPPPALLRTAPASSPSFDLAQQPQAQNRQRAGPIGPAFTPRPGDSQRIAGSGPNGEPLYAARWYREPTNGELAGYLSTASGPGWGLINCQTAPQFRVENCVLVDEWPSGSQIGRAVLAAAWQFKVRPPQIAGQPQVGEWVRIRIDYELRREP